MEWRGFALALLCACGSPLVATDAGGDHLDATTTSSTTDAASSESTAIAPTTIQSGDGSDGDTSGGDRPPPVVAFTDVTIDAGLEFVHADVRAPPYCLLDNPNDPGEGDWCTPERMTGGIAVGDYDRDGRLDLFITRLDDPALLLHNEGDGTFVDVAADAGIDADTPTNGAAFVDVERDGDLDLVVTSLGGLADHLWIQIAPGRFEDQATERGAAGLGTAPHIGETPAVGDYDRDGFPDLFVGEWRPTNMAGDEHHVRLLHNLGDGTFEDVTLAAGLGSMFTLNDGRERPGVFAFGPGFVDLDDDGWLDLAIAADFRTSRLYWNDGAGGFVDGTELAGVGTDHNGMGSTFGDIDGDGDLDWFVTAIFSENSPNLGNRLYLNDGNRSFHDASHDYGVRDAGWAWGTAMADLDNDGALDIVTTAGWMPDAFSHDPMRLWRGDAHPRVDTALDVGLDAAGRGRGLAVLDYDDDGDLDVVVAQFGATPRLYRNDSTPRTFLRVRVTSRRVEPEGGGAVVTAQAIAGGPAQVRHIGASTHLFAQSERVAHFGFGDHEGPIARVEVRLPSGRARVYEQVDPNRELLLLIE
jgi:hypothetical protein